MPTHRIPPHQLEHSRQLRTAMTDAERLLWRHLRGSQLNGHKFRRQHPVGTYIADFACLERRLIVEVDGGQHNGSAHDLARDSWLEDQGWRVLRFWNNEVLAHAEGMMTQIAQACALAGTAPPPQPSCAPRPGLQAGTVRRARRMRLETPASPPLQGEGAKP